MKSYIVVGSGILGASTAYHLAKAGAHVTLVDRQDLGQATDAAAGIVCPWLSQRRNQAWYKIAKGGAHYYTSLIQQLEEDGETDTGYKRVGAISLHTDDKKLDQMEERAYKRREDAPEIGEITRLSPDETKSLFPALSEEYGAVHISGAARVNGRALRQSLVNAAKKHGAIFIKGDAVLIHENNLVKGIHVNGETLMADQVIVTAGAWANELLQPLGVNFLVTFQKAQIVHLHMPNTNTENWPVVMPPNDQYILTFEDGRVVVGATHENDTGLDYRVTAGGLHEVFDKALSVAPGLENSTMLETRVGFRPFTPGFLPVIGPLPNFEGILVANGLGASGLTAGPYLGSELAKLALDQPIELDLSHYDVAGALE
ncbi:MULTISPECIES: NAD(P)/FAD-dependent oxidoreductase [Bacillus]|uniref:FAD-binding oxidoreductase n=1 Tax=Bacillus pseudomycoides TaxID=64104 RepID=A0A1Y3MK62_9BACI|nr:FAD-dependent oxidoreductase [Bacillus pseudomycoides]EOP54240.1 D-amino acid dehydrogenase small subunit [Bacillus cereus VD136]EOP73467.1 D-amino acid dehydrogenase small subunit [Bacillus cereus VDM006]OOG92849.1 D-amino acid dehydrogenase small subunit [Bacillus mycoides]MDF2085470.1 FAD-dependent oxidoreductase [Bacillus pseudomycoides]OUM50214.1 FAD-binding oxidoreductase [Bacillus pseudomycoides]